MALTFLRSQNKTKNDIDKAITLIGNFFSLKRSYQRNGISEQKKMNLKDEIHYYVNTHKYNMFTATTEVCEQRYNEKNIGNTLGESFTSKNSIWQFPWKTTGEHKKFVYESSENIFAKGYDALEDYVHGADKIFDEPVGAAFAALERFYDKREVHEKSLEKLNIMKTDTTHPTVSSLITSHLLSQLLYCPTNYFIDSSLTGKPLDGCPCGCGTPIQYGSSNIGSSILFYGQAGILLFPTTKDIFEDSETNSAVFHIEEPEESPGSQRLNENWNTEEEMNGENNSEICTVDNEAVDFNDTVINQVCKQTISLSIWKHKKKLFKCIGNNDSGLSTVPVCAINKKKYMVVMYNAQHDYLLRMKKKDFLNIFNKDKLEFSAIIDIWMLIHHNLFCTEPTDDAIKVLKGTGSLIPRLGEDKFRKVVKSSKFDYDTVPRGEGYEPNISDAVPATRKSRPKKYPKGLTDAVRRMI